MLSDDFLGWRKVPVAYSDWSQILDAANWVDYVDIEAVDDFAGLTVSPTEWGGFTVRYCSVKLYFDTWDHLAEFVIPQWEEY